VGEGGEFYRPMALAIIGGVIVSTLLTLLVVPSFYDSIEINRERAAVKFHARAALYHPFLAFVVTLGEALLALSFLRFLYRLVSWISRFPSPREHPVERAARLTGFAIPVDFKPRPQFWQREWGAPVEVLQPASVPLPKAEPPELAPVHSG
jgi:hypothetical protein